MSGVNDAYGHRMSSDESHTWASSPWHPLGAPGTSMAPMAWSISWAAVAAGGSPAHAAVYTMAMPDPPKDPPP